MAQPFWNSGEAVRDRQQLVKQPDNELSTGRKMHCKLILVWDLLITWGTLPLANSTRQGNCHLQISPPIIIHLPRGSPGPSPSSPPNRKLPDFQHDKRGVHGSSVQACKHQTTHYFNSME
ncbi:PREDICTED: uncharacterized protein LOC109186981 [Ipomoea nil]|uniref:uncharacterized protein LOC109186981 n=1 Tax=Ipomoea nil TaxID=35883 RepID=UPI0009010D1D|nr:PREDICTED: uncharacterized protein LOC109186981 [Ipomoea nil]XP_019192689.1 PREDICTED: uncharacterized protein LOC109186981 [Ipomoea nil]XP_019192690.1 PREDICTED: uncharacterized protein LOC109186981 [Ipomoea nil]